MVRWLFSLAVICSSSFSMAADWPQWMGPDRNDIWTETGIIREIPESGLTVKWRVPVAGGYAGPAVVGNRVLLTDFNRNSGEAFNNPGQRAELKGQERVHCLDAATGKTLWTHAYDCDYAISYPCGPRTTPTVDGDRVYTLGAEGHLFCLNLADGAVIWSKSLKEAYRTESPIWGFSAHPLVEGDQLICMVGGEGSVVVSFNKHTGEEIWKALTDKEPGYCPPSMIEAGGVRQLIIWHPQAINGLNPANGEVYWSVPLAPDYAMTIMAPRKSGDLLFASGIGNVAAVLKLGSDAPTAEVVWRGTPKNAVYCANSTPQIVDGTIYGCDCRSGALLGVRLSDGERLWQTYEPTTGKNRGGHGTAFIVKNDDRFFLFSETGDLILAKLSPEKYQELGRFHVLEPTGEAFGRNVVWSHPAFAQGSLFARNDKEIVCVSLRAE